MGSRGSFLWRSPPHLHDHKIGDSAGLGDLGQAEQNGEYSGEDHSHQKEVAQVHPLRDQAAR